MARLSLLLTVARNPFPSSGSRPIAATRRMDRRKTVPWPTELALALALALSLGLGGVSCSSTRKGSQPFAAVTLRGYEPAAIRHAVDSVFSGEGYVDASRRRLWCYERGTSKMGQLLHGGWFDEEGVRERVKLKLIPLSDGVYRLESQAVIVRDAGDAFFEEETRMTRLKSGPYRKMLEQVQEHLQNP